MTARPDVIVVGGGVWGLSTAWHLATVHGVRVEIVEARDALGLETSARAAGQIGQIREHAVARQAAHQALAFAASLAQRNDPGLFVRSGSVAVAEGEMGALAIRRRFVDASAAGVTVELISEADLAALVPGYCGRVAAAYFVPGDAYVRPPAYIAALAKEAVRAGVSVACGTRVTALLYEGGRLAGVETNLGRRSAGGVVLTAGPWTAALAPGPWAVRPIVLGQGRTMANAVHDDHPIVRFPEAGIYVRPERGAYLFGAFTRAAHVASVAGLPADARTDDLQPDYRVLDTARERLRQWLPVIGRLPVEHFREGWTTATPDGLPLVGRPASLGGAWAATGCGAMGFVWAAEIGRRLAAAVVAGRPTPDLAPFDPDRFGARAGDPDWVHDTCRRRFADYYGLDRFDPQPGTPAGPSVEHFAWK